MEFYRCENPECGRLFEGAEPPVCPHCGGETFFPVDEQELTGGEWMSLSEALRRSGDEARAAVY